MKYFIETSLINTATTTYGPIPILPISIRSLSRIEEASPDPHLFLPHHNRAPRDEIGKKKLPAMATKRRQGEAATCLP